MIRKTFVAVWLMALFCGIGYLFWHNELKYSLPTPIPANYKVVEAGAHIALESYFDHTSPGKPILFHFFNPDCPCSRFNITHFKSLVQQYGGKVDFRIIAMPSKEGYTAKNIQRKFGLDIPVLFDTLLAERCGVYSTPQAVLIGTDQKLYYRGNYNKARYCTDKETNYAQIAIDALLEKRSLPQFEEAALRSYGCELTVCTKQITGAD